MSMSVLNFYITSLSVLNALRKIAIVLLEHDDNGNQEDFEKSLITHNHLELLSV